MTYAQLETTARDVQLDVFGLLHPAAGETVLLLGPHEPGFWAVFTASPEYSDGAPDPLDRWSKRVIGQLALDWGGQAVFPSDGPPYPPFITWAVASGRSWPSPVGMLVHDRAGLMGSYRGAVTLRRHVQPPPTTGAPCDTCQTQPCRSACPVNALTGAQYDVARCKGHLSSPAGAECLSQGCAARRACPLSASYGRLAAQSAFHMKAFHPK